MSSNIEVKLDVLNQKASPALYAASLANRPAASFTGRLFVDSDSPSTGIYRDTGTSWVQVADQGAGTTGTLQQVTTNGSSTNVGINITAGGLNANNIVLNANTGIVKSTAISQIMAVNDLWEIYGIGTSTSANGEGELVFSLGDDGSPYATGGERFRFTYGSNIVTGTPKDVFIVDYNLSYFNTSLGINTPTPSSPLDIHTATGINATFNGTGTTNSSLQLQSSGVGKWNLSNFYNAGENDFVLTDVLNSVNRLVLKNTGLGTYIGFFNVANIASSQNIQISGTAPAYTIVEGTGNANTASIGVASIANNFINGSVEGDLCIVSQSTVAKRLLLGVQSANSSAICISTSNNVLINSTTDNGQKLQITGNAAITSTLKVNGASGGLSLDVLSSSTFDGIRTYNTNSTQGADIRIGNDSNNNLGFLRVGGSAYGGIYQNSLIIGTGGGYDIKIAPNGNLAITIKNGGIVNFANAPIYATNALALAGGLVAGDIYKSATGVLSIVY